MPGPVPRPGLDLIEAHMIAPLPLSGAGPPLALNSNESPYGPSPRAAEAARRAVTGIERYSDAPDRLLVPAIAERYGLDPARILCGHGSDDLLARTVRAFLGPGEELIRSVNGYPKVPNYAHACGANPVPVPDRDLVPSVDGMIAALTERTRIVYLSNPENPAGTLLEDGEIRRLHAALPRHVLLILDCAYEEYVDAVDHAPPYRLIEAAGNVVMARSFSKIHGLAGARVGWIYAPEPVIGAVRKLGSTFTLATPSVAAALAALEDQTHEARVRRETIAERTALSARLSGMGLQVVPSQTNFVLCRFPDPANGAAGAAQALARANILVRQFPSRALADCLRITLGLPEQNRIVGDRIADYVGIGG